MKTYNHIFGPVPSRRLGRSLGIDLTPFKTCSIDCIFCQLGHTTNQTLDREEYVPFDEVCAEFADWVKSDGQADVVTLSGSGEPTLHSRFGDIMAFMRSQVDIPIVLLTNGSLLFLPEVRQAAAQADIVKISLSAWDQASYTQVTRPHPDLKFDQVLGGIQQFRQEFDGKIWLEVFALLGINSGEAPMSKIAGLARTVSPDRIQLNTAVRPPAEDYAVVVPKEILLERAQLFSPRAEVIAEFSAVHSNDIQANETTILAMLQRRPCTAEQISDVFGMHLNEVAKYTGKLLRTNQIKSLRRNEQVYYEAPPQTL
jgi:wyosine [tRNA(Phe)-imidazoG37] synthetase (radical SAM superfamily)